jgi:predicted GNAT family acetyltransferase
MEKRLVHEPDAHRYALYLGDDLVSVADYAEQGGAISFHHTFTNPRYRGQGLAAELVDFAMDDVERRTDRRVLPMCWYVADWFDAHPGRAGLLSR